MISYRLGFVIGDDGRVAIDAVDPAYYFHGKPIGLDGEENAGTNEGSAITFNAGQGFVQDGEMLFTATSGEVFTGITRYVNCLPYTDSGALIVDFTLPVSHYVCGIPFCINGSVAATYGGHPPPSMIGLVTETGIFVMTESGLNIVV